MFLVRRLLSLFAIDRENAQREAPAQVDIRKINYPHQPCPTGEGILFYNLALKHMEGEPIISIIFTRLRGVS